MNTLVGNTYMKYATTMSKKKVRFGLFKCKYCEKLYEAQYYQVKVGHSSSCGCRKGFLPNNKPFNKSKYDTESALYKKFEAMKARCANNKYYTVKGITVYKEWIEDFGIFKDWAITNGYKKGFDIHRMDNNGNYEPNNCIFLTHNEHTSLHNKQRKGLYSGRF